jgi:hypothetical protein
MWFAPSIFDIESTISTLTPSAFLGGIMQ